MKSNNYQLLPSIQSKFLGIHNVGHPYSKNGQYTGKVIPSHQVKSQKIARNKPCPCGSEIKYKKCCGKPRKP